jgi:hypothetical protein
MFPCLIVCCQHPLAVVGQDPRWDGNHNKGMALSSIADGGRCWQSLEDGSQVKDA